MRTKFHFRLIEEKPLVFQKKIVIALSVALIFAISLQNLSASQVVGPQTGTWGIEDSVYFVIGDVWVPPENDLTILAGVEVIFQGNYSLIDSGALIAVGIEGEAEDDRSDWIKFSGANGAIWKGLQFVNCDARSVVSRCDIEDVEIGISAINCDQLRIENNSIIASSVGIDCAESSPSIRNNELIKVEGDSRIGARYKAISLLYESNPIIESNKRIECIGSAGGESNAIYIYDSSPIIKFNWIEANAEDGYAAGINIEYSDSLEVYRNIIRTNSYQNSDITRIEASSNISIVNNTMDLIGSSQQTAVGIQIEISSEIYILNNIVVGNYNSIGLKTDLISEIVDSSGYNDFYAHDSNYDFGDEFDLILRGDISADPLFEEVDGDPYHLSWSDFPYSSENKSPCIDAGYLQEDLGDVPHFLPGDDEPHYTPDDMGRHRHIYDPNDLVNVDLKINPVTYNLISAYPNPFNSTINLTYQQAIDGEVNFRIYDITGRFVTLLENKWQSAGDYHIAWTPLNVSAGEYFLIYNYADKSGAKKILYLP